MITENRLNDLFFEAGYLFVNFVKRNLMNEKIGSIFIEKIV